MKEDGLEKIAVGGSGCFRRFSCPQMECSTSSARNDCIISSDNECAHHGVSPRWQGMPYDISTVGKAAIYGSRRTYADALTNKVNLVDNETEETQSNSEDLEETLSYDAYQEASEFFAASEMLHGTFCELFEIIVFH